MRTRNHLLGQTLAAAVVFLGTVASCVTFSVVAASEAGASAPPLVWSLTAGSGDQFTSIANGSTASGMQYFIAGTSSGAIEYSTNGFTWETTTTPDQSADWLGVAADAHNHAVAVSNSGQAVYLNTGALSWSASQFVGAQPTSLNAVAANATGFVAVSSTGQIFFSTDGGATWNLEATEAGAFYTVTATTAGFVALGSAAFGSYGSPGGLGCYSTNGTSWSSATIPQEQWLAVAGDGSGNYVAVTPTGYVGRSSNGGHSWTLSGSPLLAEGTSAIAYGNGRYVTLAQASGSANSQSSSDGSSWTSDTAANNQPMYDWSALAFGENAFLAVDSGGASMIAAGAAPSAIAVPTLVAADGDIFVTWAEPTNNISQVTYSVSVYDDNDNQTVNTCVGATLPFCIISNVNSMAIYAISVSASNAHGSTSSPEAIIATFDNSLDGTFAQLSVGETSQTCFPGFVPDEEVFVEASGHSKFMTADDTGTMCLSVTGRDPSIRINGGAWVSVPYGPVVITVKGKAPDGQNKVAVDAVRLNPKGLPSPPRHVSVKVRSKTVSVTWKAPVSNGGHKLTKYVVYLSGSKHSCTTSKSRCVFSGLSLKRRYQIGVVARNSVGASSVANSALFKG